MPPHPPHPPGASHAPACAPGTSSSPYIYIYIPAQEREYSESFLGNASHQGPRPRNPRERKLSHLVTARRSFSPRPRCISLRFRRSALLQQQPPRKFAHVYSSSAARASCTSDGFISDNRCENARGSFFLSRRERCTFFGAGWLFFLCFWVGGVCGIMLEVAVEFIICSGVWVWVTEKISTGREFRG